VYKKHSGPGGEGGGGGSPKSILVERKHAICKYVPLCAYNKIGDREGRKRDMVGGMLYVSMCHCVPTTRLETEREGRGTW
jgi:hypothetical protein